MPKLIVTDHDAKLTNSVATMLPTSYALLYEYHITKNARSRLKHVVGTRQIKGEDEKIFKLDVLVE